MNVIELISRRVRQRTDNAADTLAAAARAHAAGETIDFAAVEAALFDGRHDVAYFDGLCQTAAKRRDRLAELEKLPAATSRHAKATSAAEAEKRRFDDLRAAYLSKMAAIEADVATALATINKAEEARQWLLDPRNVIGSVADKLKAAVEEQREATLELDRLRRELKGHNGKIAEADRWIDSIRRNYESELKPTLLIGRPKVSEKEARECEPHEIAKGRAQRRIDETTPLVKAAEDRLDRADRALAAAQLEALKG